MEGWIKLSRKLLDWEYFNDEIMLRGWLYILLKANSEDKEWKQGVTIKRGQLVTSLAKIAKDLNISVQQARRMLTNMQNTHEITRKTTNKYTIITICKFDYYQDSKKRKQQANQQANQHADQQGNQQANQQQLKNKEEKNKEYNNISLSNTRTKEEFSWAMEVVNATAQVETFCMQEQITPQEFKNYAFAVMNEWEMVGKTHTDRSDMKSHLIATIRKKIQDQKTQKINGNNRTSNWQQTNGAGREQRAAAYMSAIASLAAEDDARAAKVRQS